MCGGGVTPPTQEVNCDIVLGVWWMMSLCRVRVRVLILLSDITCELLLVVKFSFRMDIHEEDFCGCLEVFWPLLALSNFRSLANKHSVWL